MLNTFVVYVENKPGVLTRVASLFRRRAFNIDSLTVGRTEKPEVSRMTIVVDADRDQALRVEANLYKLVNVLFGWKCCGPTACWKWCEPASSPCAAAANPRLPVLPLPQGMAPNLPPGLPRPMTTFPIRFKGIRRIATRSSFLQIPTCPADTGF